MDQMKNIQFLNLKNHYYLIKNKSGVDISGRKKLSLADINLPEIEINSILNPMILNFYLGWGGLQ